MTIKLLWLLLGVAIGIFGQECHKAGYQAGYAAMEQEIEQNVHDYWEKKILKGEL